MQQERTDLESRQPDYSGVKIAAVSLGCSKNRIDTEELLGLLASWGCVFTEDYRAADIIIVNTCGFIEEAQQESIDTLLGMAAQTAGKRPKIVAAGCLVEVFGSKITRAVPEVDGAIGVHSYRRLDKFLRMLLAGKRPVIKAKPSPVYCSLAPRILTTPGHSAVVKIGEGCSNRCSYCLIPAIRGPYRSRPPEEIKAEVEALVQKGTREISLIAQDTTAYGSEQDDLPDLAGLIRQILEIEDHFWLRIMYTYPARISDELIDLIASENRVCNYLDIPIQHVSAGVLTGMGRQYNRDDLGRLFSKLRRSIPNLALRTTCMVGYPGEGPREFEELLDFVKEQRLDRLGTFTYSPQEKTAAFNADNPVPARVAKKRHRTLMLTQRRISEELNRKLVGRTLTVLVDKNLKPGSSWYTGRTEYQAPEIDGSVYFKTSSPLKPGDMITVRVTAASPYSLLAVRSGEKAAV